MKVQLKAEEKKLQESEVQTNQLLARVQSESAKAEKKSQGVCIVLIRKLQLGVHSTKRCVFRFLRNFFPIVDLLTLLALPYAQRRWQHSEMNA